MAHRPNNDKARKRRAVAKRDGERCRWCGVDENLTIDHIRPLSRGGSGRPEDLQLLCRPCNQIKGAKMYASLAEAGAARLRRAWGAA
ncbi:MAG: HNH endonuclease [Thermoanaerobaculia bacterium]